MFDYMKGGGSLSYVNASRTMQLIITEKEGHMGT
jgi:hypothetical protein